MDRRTLAAIVICFGIVFGWQKFYIEPRMKQVQPVAAQQEAAPQSAAPSAQAIVPSNTSVTKSASSASSSAAVQGQAVEKRTIQASTGAAELSNGTALFSGWMLSSYKTALGISGRAMELSDVTHSQGQLEFGLDDPSYAYLTKAVGVWSQAADGALVSTFEDQNIRLVREVRQVPGQDYLDVKISADFKGGKTPKFAFVSLNTATKKDDTEAQDRQLIYWTNDSVDRVHASDVSLKDVMTPVKYIGVQSRYFVMTAMPTGNVEPKGLVQPTFEKAGRVSLVYPVSGTSIVMPMKVYFGPKNLDILRKIDKKLDQVVDFGWLAMVAYPILTFLKLINQLFHNYGLSIIILTIVIKLLLYPMVVKSTKSMKQMQEIQPKLNKLKEKYKNDKEALNREMMALMKSHGYNPASGCLPLLIQMPVFFALYRVLYNAIELYQAPAGLWIHDLSAKDPYYVLPVTLTITMWLQMRLSPASPGVDPTQQKVMQMMPLMFGFFMMTTPAGLGIYMLVNVLVSIGQQMYLNKKFHIKPAQAQADVVVVK